MVLLCLRRSFDELGYRTIEKAAYTNVRGFALYQTTDPILISEVIDGLTVAVRYGSNSVTVSINRRPSSVYRERRTIQTAVVHVSTNIDGHISVRLNVNDDLRTVLRVVAAELSDRPARDIASSAAAPTAAIARINDRLVVHRADGPKTVSLSINACGVAVDVNDISGLIISIGDISVDVCRNPAVIIDGQHYLRTIRSVSVERAASPTRRARLTTTPTAACVVTAVVDRFAVRGADGSEAIT